MADPTPDHAPAVRMPPFADELVNRKTVLFCLGLVLLIGIFLRLPPALFNPGPAPLHSLAPLHPNPKWQELGMIGVDEKLYRVYVDQLSEKGLFRYPEIVREYNEKQASFPDPFLPPVR